MLDEAVREYKIEGLAGNDAIRIASISGDAGEPGKLRVILIREVDDRDMLRQRGSTLPEAGFPSQVKYVHVFQLW
jgi:hypothetical protein